MKTTFMIAIAVVVIVIIIGSVFAYTYLSQIQRSPTPTPSPTPTATASPTQLPPQPPTAKPTSTPTAKPTAAPTPTPSPTPVPTIAPSTQILGSGGTLVAPLMADWQVAYNQYQPKVEVNYNAVGSGQGITDFQGGVNNFGESDAPLTVNRYREAPIRLNCFNYTNIRQRGRTSLQPKTSQRHNMPKRPQLHRSSPSKHFLRNHNYLE